MDGLASLDRLEPGAGAELEQARESLAYWEARARSLPVHAVRRRREAREMTVRWQRRVAEAERAAYGRGLMGALVLMAAERRLPEPACRAARHLARRTAQLAVLVVAVAAAVVAAGLLAAAELLSALL